MKKVLFLVIAFCTTTNILNAQVTITAIITEALTGDPIPGANIAFEGTNRGTVTDFDGRFTIDASQLNSILSISFIGFETLQINAEEILNAFGCECIDKYNSKQPSEKTLNKSINLLEYLNCLDEDKQSSPLLYTTSKNSTPAQLIIGLKPDKNFKVVFVGSNWTPRKIFLAGAITNVDKVNISSYSSSDFNSSLQGRVSGLNIQTPSGRPGAKANAQLRGTSALTNSFVSSTSDDALSVNMPWQLGPLYVVDGIPHIGIPTIPTEQIESINILKGGSLATVYGTNATNGVILITTKKGKEGNSGVKVSAYSGIQKINPSLKLMNSEQQLRFDQLLNPAFYVNQLDAQGENIDTDYIKMIQNDNARINKVNLNITKGHENLRVNANFDYFKQVGMLINSDYEQFASRISSKISEGKFDFIASLGYTREDMNIEPWALTEMAIRQKPWSEHLENIEFNNTAAETINQSDVNHHYLNHIFNNQDNKTTNHMDLKVNAKYEIFMGLTYTALYGFERTDERREMQSSPYHVLNWEGVSNPIATKQNTTHNNLDFLTNHHFLENILSYEHNFGDHNFFLLYTNSIENISIKNKHNKSIYVYSTGSGSFETTESYLIPPLVKTKVNNREVGNLFRLKYNYRDKYLFSGTLRKDYSTQINNNVRIFPGIALGWNISEEGFIPNIYFIEDLILRMSYAQVGNTRLPFNNYISVLGQGAYSPFDQPELFQNSSIPLRFIDENIKRELAFSKNIGLDLSILNGVLDFNINYYHIKKEKLFIEKNITAEAGTLNGVTTLITNGGSMVNRGFELAVDFMERMEFGLDINIGATFTKNINKVTSLEGAEDIWVNSQPIVSINSGHENLSFLAEGHEAGAFFLIETDGVIKTETQLEEYRNTVDANAQIGDLYYIDQNGDGEINDQDLIYKGSGQSKWEGGLSVAMDYRGIDLTVQSYVSYGAKIYNGAKAFAYNVGRHADLQNTWSLQNQESSIPRYRQTDEDFIKYNSDFFLEDGSYLRIKSISLGYTFRNFSKKMNKLRFYISATNPFTFTNYSGSDPEIGGDGLFTRGIDRGTYPIGKQYILGLQMDL